MVNLKNIVYILSVLSFFLCLFQEGNPKYPFLFALPLSLLVVSLFFYKIYELLKNSIVFNIFIVQAVIRYCIVPYKIASGDFIHVGFNSLNGNTAVFLMVLEIMFAFISLQILANKQSITYINRTKTVTVLNNSILIYCLIIGLFGLIYVSGHLAKVNFIWDLETYVQKYIVDNEELHDSGLAGILFTPFKVIVALFLISRVYLSKISYNKKKYFYLIILILASLFIVGISRLSILQFIFPLLVLVSLILDRKSAKQLITTTVIALIPVIFITSIAKFSRGDTQASSEDIFSTSSMNAYFAGPGNVATGIDAYEKLSLKNNSLFLINDMFQNAPGFSKYTLDAYKTNVIFNNEIYGSNSSSDQIVPLSTSGIFHFGFLGGFVYVPLFLVVALYMERKAYKERFLGYKYVFISLSITLSMVFMLNIGSFYFSIFSNLLFIYLPFYLIKKLQLLKK